ncbi:MAG: 3-deoxy-manno-octulosonate cytidylyltransferase [Gammaproteobacteria bacterium]|nr:3-deoxy-manno-octulosonate cytidylyltransferase [Gammaproteobacteria bacterium]
MRAFKVVIPARYASQRLPGKPLLDIAGKPMIQHVYERACESGAGDVVIATDDDRIRATAAGFGGQVCMTSAEHSSGTDRIAEVVTQLGWPDDTLIVNLQGDEPLMPPVLLSQVAVTLEEHTDAGMATLAVPLDSTQQLFDPNCVKVVTDHAGYALYFSRATIPWKRDMFKRDATAESAWLEGIHRHLGIYAYRAGFLTRYASLPVSPIERMEALEQLRVLWNGGRIAVDIAQHVPPAGVDTAEDLARVSAVLSA